MAVQLTLHILVRKAFNLYACNCLVLLYFCASTVDGYSGLVVKPKPQTHEFRTVQTPMTTLMTTGYNKPSYPVLIGDTVRVYATKDFAALPHLSKFIVKERLPNSTKARLVLKSSEIERSVESYTSHAFKKILECTDPALLSLMPHQVQYKQ